MSRRRGLRRFSRSLSERHAPLTVLKGDALGTFDRLEWKDFEAYREKMFIMSALISRLEGEFGALPADPAVDVLEADRNG